MDQFWKLVAHGEPDACWEWQGTRSKKGYGRFFHNGKEHGAHRKAWELANQAQIPKGLNVCHSCDHPPCCNPAHLRVDTTAGNMQERDAKRRGRNSRKTHCPEGHPYDAENLRITALGARVCRGCHQKWQRERSADPDFKEYRKEYLKEWRKTPVADTRTHCTSGHELTDDNVYVKPNGYRECRTCALEARRKRDKVKQPRTGPDRTHCSRGHPLDAKNGHRKTDGTLECRICAAAAARERRARRGSQTPT